MKTLKQYVRFVLLLTICFSVVWPGGAWAAAGDEMMGPGLKPVSYTHLFSGTSGRLPRVIGRAKKRKKHICCWGRSLL